MVLNNSAQTYFGIRHGLETLSQLITFDADNSLEEDLHMPSSVTIKDEPMYPYRGLLLDTSRNYFSIDSIKVHKTNHNRILCYPTAEMAVLFLLRRLVFGTDNCYI